MSMKLFDGETVPFVNNTSNTIPENRVVNLGTATNPLFGVTLTPVPVGAQGAIQTWGVFRLAKQSGQSFNVGDTVYWDATNNVCTTTSTGNIKIGRAFAAAAATAATVDVYLIQTV